jgi:hypothetical protein
MSQKRTGTTTIGACRDARTILEVRYPASKNRWQPDLTARHHNGTKVIILIAEFANRAPGKERVWCYRLP